MRPSVTVICTARNAAKTIEETLASVLSQTLEDWEMIVVDDGSTDRTAECVEGLAAREPRIRLVRTEGVGRARALNLAVDSARSDLVANIDADDLFHPDHLRTLVAVFKGTSPFSLLCTNSTPFHNAETPQWHRSLEPGDEENLAIEDVTDRLLVRNPVCHSSILTDKKTLAAVGAYDESLPSQFDYDLWIRLAKHGHRIGRIQLPLVAKRIHSGQSFEARRRTRYLINSARTQARAIRELNGRWQHWVMLATRMIWGLRPRRTWKQVLAWVGLKSNPTT